MKSLGGLVESERRNGAFWIWLNRPERHNALVPDLLSGLTAALDAAEEAGPSVLVLSGRGASFSTGGDISGFLDKSGSLAALHAYADQLVDALHDVILRLLSFPVPVLGAVNGPVTGGSTGLMLAADMVAMSETAFVQPYYGTVGFGPDGGWTALLPDRVGTAKALEIQYLNTRISAHEALDLGLASAIRPRSELEAQMDRWTGLISAQSALTHRATRSGVWDAHRIAEVRTRLDQEKARFLELITLPQTLAGMKVFTQKRA